jgi:hypothetical protein
MTRLRPVAIAFFILALFWPAAAAEQPEVLLGVSLDFDKGQITLEVASSGCTKKEDFRLEYANRVLTVIRKERDACKAMPQKIALTFPLKEIGIAPHTAFRIANTFIANEMMAR